MEGKFQGHGYLRLWKCCLKSAVRQKQVIHADTVRSLRCITHMALCFVVVRKRAAITSDGLVSIICIGVFASDFIVVIKH